MWCLKSIPKGAVASVVGGKTHNNGERTWNTNNSVNGKGGMNFTINSKSQVDYGLAPKGFARSQQKESWKEVLSNFTKTSGGNEIKRTIK